MRYRLSQAAESDVLRLYAASAAEFGRGQAESYLSGLSETFDFLAQFPRAARERMETSPPVRIHPFRSHVIVYVVDEVGVRVLRVRHAREDWERSPL